MLADAQYWLLKVVFYKECIDVIPENMFNFSG